MGGEQEMRDLWDAIGEVRDGMTEIIAQLRALTAALTERCETRSTIIINLDARIKTLEEKYHLMDKQVLRVSLITGLVSAVLSSAGTAVLVQVVLSSMSLAAR